MKKANMAKIPYRISNMNGTINAFRCLNICGAMESSHLQGSTQKSKMKRKLK